MDGASEERWVDHETTHNAGRDLLRSLSDQPVVVFDVEKASSLPRLKLRKGHTIRVP